MLNPSLTAVHGLLAGHWTHPSGTTGVTAVLFPEGARAGFAQPGPASGTRELAALSPRHLADRIHGICLSGGSAFGLAAADGVMAVLAARGIGFPLPGGPVPIVPAAILYDLDSGPHRPDRDAGVAAAEAATGGPLACGRVGAGAGARVGRATGQPSPGGFGGWAEQVGPGVVAAGVACNALGAVRDPDTGAWLTAPPTSLDAGAPLQHTSLVVVATDAPLERAQAAVLATMASAGLARTLYPAFSPFDGDTIFAASLGEGELVTPRELMQIGHAAAWAVARAVVRSVVS